MPDKNPRIEVYLLCAKADRMTHTAYVARKKRQEGYVCVHAYVRVHSAVCVPACARDTPPLLGQVEGPRQGRAWFSVFRSLERVVDR